MKYRVVESFHDRHLNRDIMEGSIYPPAGAEVSEDWINTLLTEKNKCARVFIEPIEEGEGGGGPKKPAAKKPEKP